MTTTSRSSVVRALRSAVPVLGVLTGTVTLTGCRGCGEEPPGPVASASSESAAAPVDAPATLVAEVVVAKPDATWTAVRELVGFPATALPASAGLLVGTLLGWSGVTSSRFSGDVPMLGAVLADPDRPGEAVPVLAVHVRSGAELVASQTTGNAAGYTARRDPGTGVTFLEPIPGKAPTGYAAGIVGNYLVVGPEPRHVATAGPYLARTLSRRPPPPEPFVVTATQGGLGKNVAPLLEAAWKAYRAELEREDAANRARHGGRAPDFGDPAAALAAAEGVVERAKAVLGSARSARLVAAPAADRLEVTVRVEAADGGEAHRAFGEMVTGDVAPLLALPKRTLAAVLTRSTKETRAASSDALGRGLAGVLGERLRAADDAKLRDAVGAISSAQGDWVAWALLGDPALYVRTPATDPKAVDAGAKVLLGLFQLEAFTEPVRQFVGDVAVKHSTVDVPGVGADVRRALVAIRPAPMRLGGAGSAAVTLEPPPFEVLWTVRDGVAHGVVAGEATRALVDAAAPGADPATTLAADGRAGAALGRVGKDTAYVVFAQPLRLGLFGRGLGADAPSSPVVLSMGGAGTAWSLRAEVGKETLGELARRSAP